MDDSSEAHEKSTKKSFFFRQLPLETETTLFILVNALDIIMTWILLTRGGFVESNPVANYFLAHWGKKGFVAFKFSSVVVVCLTTQIIATQKPRLARFILIAGIIVVGYVVAYSFFLYLKFGHPIP